MFIKVSLFDVLLYTSFVLTEIIRVSGMVPKGFGHYDRLQHGSPRPMASPKLTSAIGDTDLMAWSGLQQEVSV